MSVIGSLNKAIFQKENPKENKHQSTTIEIRKMKHFKSPTHTKEKSDLEAKLRELLVS